MEMPKISNHVMNTYTSDSTNPYWISVRDNSVDQYIVGHSDFTGFNPCKEVTLTKTDICTLPYEDEEPMSSRRLVRVLIVDPDERVPVETAILIQTDERVTDLDDQELFFELDIKSILENHNSYRQSILDKAASEKTGKDIYLEPIRIRDLRMMVLKIAEF